MLAEFFGAHMDTGALRRDDPGEAAAMFLSLCAGSYPQRLLWGVEERDEAEIRREAAGIAANFLRCYRPG